MELNVNENILVTAKNEHIPFSQVTQQHWSNVYWYNTIFQRKSGMPIHLMVQAAELSRIELERRFGGVILEFRPIYAFETAWLFELHDNPVSNVQIIGTAIYFEGRKVGNILTQNLVVV